MMNCAGCRKRRSNVCADAAARTAVCRGGQSCRPRAPAEYGWAQAARAKCACAKPAAAEKTAVRPYQNAFEPAGNRDLTYPSFKEYFEPETQKSKAQTEQSTKANLLDDVLREPDEAMLFSLLLLKSEGADESLLMALLYIMS